MIIDVLYIFATLLPSLSVQVRRLHDIGKGGDWIFIVGESQITINVSNFAKGAYVVKIYTDAGIENKKVIIE